MSEIQHSKAPDGTDTAAPERDRIEKEITIAASPERVWAVLTEPKHVGNWFGQGEPTPVDLRPGGTMLLDHGEYGTFPTTIVEVDPPHRFVYRWAAAHPGEQAVEGNSTLVEFTLVPDGEGTHLTVVETGFTTLDVPADSVETASYESHEGGWAGQVVNIKTYAETGATGRTDGVTGGNCEDAGS
ncbi:SRPBCC family protein [Streptomyces sp. NPDC048057]|uniref:SRPBCC family protein n=1 Tax=Streptomyces sp. NPDC048057 TaxID=3155628 RepID=UPI0033E979DE